VITIHAQKNNVTKISIIGGIGKSLKGKGVTLQDVQSQISNIEGDIEVEIHSMGGYGYEGLLIHEALKGHKGNVDTTIIGLTASAGTYPFLSGTNRRIAANAQFLIHESHVKDVSGNAKKLQQIVDELEGYDEIQAEFYLPYCLPKGKSLEDIKALMAEERWISSAEAIEWGFATEVIEDYAIAAEYTHELIEAAGLPQLPDNYYIQMENNKTAIDTFLAKIGLQTIKAEVTVDTLAAENESLKSEVEELKAKLNGIETTTETEKQTIIEASKTSITEIEAKFTAASTELATAKSELETVQAQLERAKLGGFKIEASADPDPSGEPKKLSEKQQVLADILASATETEKTLYQPIKN
jgi:ATP-dependent protease ClpP protease subunit